MTKRHKLPNRGYIRTRFLFVDPSKENRCRIRYPQKVQVLSV